MLFLMSFCCFRCYDLAVEFLNVQRKEEQASMIVNEIKISGISLVLGVIHPDENVAFLMISFSNSQILYMP